VSRAPENFWANFYQGQVAYSGGRYQEAVAAFRACIVLEPRRAECYYHRGLAFASLKETRSALRDYDRALELEPRLAPAFLNRGLLHLQAKEYRRARADFQAARETERSRPWSTGIWHF